VNTEPETRFEDLVPGLELPSFSYVVDEEAIHDYWVAQGEERPVAWRSLPIPVLLLDTLHPLRSAVRMPEGVLHAREALHLLAPARVWDTVHVRIGVLDRYVRNNRLYVVFAQTASGADGHQLAVSQKTVVWPS
jgi:hypothetical protein